SSSLAVFRLVLSSPTRRLPIWPDQLAVRRADLRAAVLRGRRPAGAVSQRLVRGIAAHRTGDHLRGAHLQALLPQPPRPAAADQRSEEHTSELQSRENLVCRLLL